jgi:HEPN domain-containing protein
METEFLKQRAEDFRKTARYHLEQEMYHLAAFDLEQALQLYLKYTLLVKLRDFPRVHSLRDLLRAVGRAYDKENEFRKVIDDNVHVLADLEEAYLTSRYLPVEFSKKQVEGLGKFADKIIERLKDLWPEH